MSLSAEQILDLRADLGDETAPYAFTDAQLDRLYARSDSNYNSTLILAIDQLLMNATKFYNYAAGYTRQEQNDIFKNLKAMREMLIRRSNGAKIVGVGFVPPYIKDEPDA